MTKRIRLLPYRRSLKASVKRITAAPDTTTMIIVIPDQSDREGPSLFMIYQIKESGATAPLLDVKGDGQIKINPGRPTVVLARLPFLRVGFHHPHSFLVAIAATRHTAQHLYIADGSVNLNHKLKVYLAADASLARHSGILDVFGDVISECIEA